jgi:hypothetical protein
MSVTSEYPVTDGPFKTNEQAYGKMSPPGQVAGRMTLGNTNHEGKVDQIPTTSDRVWKMHFPNLTAGNGYKLYVNNTLVADNVTVSAP